MKKIIKMTVATLVLFLVFSTLSITTTEKAHAATQFNDLKLGDFGFEAIIDLYERGVVTGFPGAEFQPNGKLNRAQAAVMFQRALELPIPDNTTSFKDVKNGMYYTDEVAATMQAGIFKGNPDGTFGPNEQLSRQQMASLLVRAMDLKPNEAAPVTINDEDQIHPSHQEDVLILYQNGVTKGKPGDLFDPKGEVTRAEFSVFVVRGVGENLPPKKEELITKDPEEKVDEENLEVQPPIAGGGAPTGPQVSSSYLETPSERFDGSVSNSTVTFTIAKGKLANLTSAKITVSANSTMTVSVYIGDNIGIDEVRTQVLTAGENDLNIAGTISSYAGIIELLGSFSAQGTLVDAAGNSSNISLIFNITN